MKRPGLLCTTLLTLLLTGGVLAHAGWLTQHPSRSPGPRRAEAHSARVDLVSQEAAWRWRRCQPPHWRGYLLQH
jgi:hypothetical protein